jgi:hypothetical protein
MKLQRVAVDSYTNGEVLVDLSITEKWECLGIFLPCTLETSPLERVIDFYSCRALALSTPKSELFGLGGRTWTKTLQRLSLILRLNEL